MGGVTREIGGREIGKQPKKRGRKRRLRKGKINPTTPALGGKKVENACNPPSPNKNQRKKAIRGVGGEQSKENLKKKGSRWDSHTSKHREKNSREKPENLKGGCGEN